MKLSKKEAKDLLDRLKLPVSSNRATVLASGTKAMRQKLIRCRGHEDRQIAAAIEIQRIFRGYNLRCKLFEVLHAGISGEKQSPHSSYRWSELSVKNSQDSLYSQIDIPIIVCPAPSIQPSPEKPPKTPVKPQSRVNLEERYYNWIKEYGPIPFEDYCAGVIQSQWRRMSEKRRSQSVCHSLSYSSCHPVSLAESYPSSSSRVRNKMSSHSSSRVSDQLTRDGAAVIIQRTWRKHVDMQVYHYYRDLINFKFRGDPALLLRCINPREAELLDPGSGTHVKFRLAGYTFPPNIYYKIYTHRTVVDMCANSPKDYTKAATKQLMARQCNNKSYTSTMQDNKEGWYERYENNGWRLVHDRVLRKIDEDAISYDSAAKRTEFKHSKLLRSEDLQKKRKKRKIEWLKKMYKEGMLSTKQGTDHSALKVIEDSLDGIVRVTDHQGYEGVEDWEVDEILQWTNALNFDSYVSSWKEYGTSALAGPISEKPTFFRDSSQDTSLSYTR